MYQSGLGDTGVFDAIILTSSPSTQFAIGPTFTGPSATERGLGTGKWQAGVTAIPLYTSSGGALFGAVIQWQHSFAGDQHRPETNGAIIQPAMIWPIGAGYYLKSSEAVWGWDFRNHLLLVPLGLGVGNVFQWGPARTNASIEPDFTLYHKSTGLPSFQLNVKFVLQWVSLYDGSGSWPGMSSFLPSAAFFTLLPASNRNRLTNDDAPTTKNSLRAGRTMRKCRQVQK